MSAIAWLSRAPIATAGGLLTSGMLKSWCKDSDTLTGGRFMKGVQFLIDEKGIRTGVLIDLKKNGRLREDFFDLALRGNGDKNRVNPLRRSRSN